jgi:hypothetical protein
LLVLLLPQPLQLCAAEAARAHAPLWEWLQRLLEGWV